MNSNLVLIVTLLLCFTDFSACGSWNQRSRYRKSTDTQTNRKSIVTMPSGKKYRMANPDVSLNGNCDKADLVEVDPSRKEYEVVERELRTHFGVVGTYQVQKIINKCLWDYYTCNRDRISRRSEIGANETFLFAVNSDNRMEDIINKGIDEGLRIDFSGEPKGLQFFDRTTKIRAKGSWYAYLYRVALGKVYYINSPTSMTYPPAGYHSISFRTPNTTQIIYTIMRGEQAYPEYRIDYNISTTI